MSKPVIVLLGSLAALLVLAPFAAADAPGADPLGATLGTTPEELLDEARRTATAAAQELGDVVDETAGNGGNAPPEQDKPDDGGAATGGAGLADGFLELLVSPGGLALLTALGVVGLAGAGILLATRYVDPDEALENPQRAMLYGCIRGHPGVNLKQLSEDFDMKTSTVLWHIRKLEGAELVRSQKANGLRVFYPVQGGVEAKRLGAAVAALANDNASTILDYVTIHPGTGQKGLVNALGINAGTVRWHLRKLKDTGLMAELSQGRTCTYFPTELGIKALRQTLGLSQDVKPVPAFVTEATATP